MRRSRTAEPWWGVGCLAALGFVLLAWSRFAHAAMALNDARPDKDFSSAHLLNWLGLADLALAAVVAVVLLVKRPQVEENDWWQASDGKWYPPDARRDR